MISIIIPYYNIKENFLIECMESIKRQSYKDFEVIVIDDGSLNPFDKIIDIKKFDFKIKYIRKENEGVSVARNVGIENADGEYLLFLDADDYLLPNCCKNLYKIASENDADIVFSKNLLTSNKKSTFYDEANYNDVQVLKKKDIMVAILEHTKPYLECEYGSPWAKLVKKEVIKRNNILFPVGIKKSQDRIFMLQLVEDSSNMIYTSSYTYVYRDDNVTSICNKYNPEIDTILYDALNEIDIFLFKNKLNEELRNSRDIAVINFLFIIMKLKIFNLNNKEKLIKKINELENICFKFGVYDILNRNLINVGKTRKFLLNLLKNKRYLILYICFNLKMKLDKWGVKNYEK